MAKHPMPLYQTASPTAVVGSSPSAEKFLQQLKAAQSNTSSIPDDVSATDCSQPEVGYLSPSDTDISDTDSKTTILDPNIVKDTGAEQYAQQVGRGCMSKPVGADGDDDPNDGSQPPNNNNTPGGAGAPDKSGDADGKKPPQDNGDDGDDAPDFYVQDRRLLLAQQDQGYNPPLIGMGWTASDGNSAMIEYSSRLVKNLEDQGYSPILIMKDTKTLCNGSVTDRNSLGLASLNRTLFRDPAILEGLENGGLEPAQLYTQIITDYLPENVDHNHTKYGGTLFFGGLHFIGSSLSHGLFMIGGGYGDNGQQDLLTLDPKIPRRYNHPNMHPGVVGHKALNDGSDQFWIGREDLINISKNIHLAQPNFKPAIIQIAPSNHFIDGTEGGLRVNENVMPHSVNLAGKMDEFHIAMNPRSQRRMDSGTPNDQYGGWTMNDNGVVVKAQSNDLEDDDTHDVSFDYVGQDQAYLDSRGVVKISGRHFKRNCNDFHAFVRDDLEQPLSTKGFVVPDKTDTIDVIEADDEKQEELIKDVGRTTSAGADYTNIAQVDDDDEDNEDETLLGVNDGRTDLLSGINNQASQQYAAVDQDDEYEMEIID